MSNIDGEVARSTDRLDGAKRLPLELDYVPVREDVLTLSNIEVTCFPRYPDQARSYESTEL